MRALSLFLALAFASCGGGASSPTPVPSTAPPAEPTPDPDPDPAVPPPSAAPTADPTPSPTPTGEPPEVTFTVTPSHRGAFAMSLTNRGAGAVGLGRSVIVEREHGGAYEAVSAAGLSLRPDCEHDAPDCVTLGPGAELLPPDWNGMAGDAQCVCTRCAPVEAGTYRLVVRTCDGGHRVESAPFVVEAR
jgi:hypothetical protein